MVPGSDSVRRGRYPAFAPHPSSRCAWAVGPGRGGLRQLSERKGECRDASDEHDESECRNASRNQPEPSRSESPSQGEHPSLAERGADEPKRQDGERGQEPARRTKLDERPLVADTSLSTCVSGSDLSMLAVVGENRVGRWHLHHDSQRRRPDKDRDAEGPGGPYADAATCRAPR